MFTRPVILIAFTLACAAVSGLAWFRYFQTGPELASMAGGNVLLLHAAAALLAAVIAALFTGPGGFRTRATLTVFFLAIGLVLPVAGILAVGATALVLTIPSRGGIRAEDAYVFGNPQATAARRESAATPPVLLPITESFRTMDTRELSRLALGLRGLHPVPAAACFLRRFQRDEEATIQFAAQAVMDTAVEDLESRLKVLQQLPPTPANRRAIALTLTELASWPPPGDASIAVYRRQAAEVTDG